MNKNTFPIIIQRQSRGKSNLYNPARDDQVWWFTNPVTFQVPKGPRSYRKSHGGAIVPLQWLQKSVGA